MQKIYLEDGKNTLISLTLRFDSIMAVIEKSKNLGVLYVEEVMWSFQTHEQ